MTLETRDEARLEQQRHANERLVMALLRETERAERAEQKTEAAEARERDLRNVAEFRERLIGIVGHDLRNPLNAVLMASDLLLSGARLSPPDAHLATRVRESARRMKRIIVQVLEFTRARLGGGFVLDRKPTDLAEVARRIADELKLASGRDIRVDNLGEVTGSWDGELLGEVLSNLVGNAVQHSAPSTHVAVTVAGRGGWVAAAVTNYGPTIPPEVCAQIFEPFRQGVAVPTRLGHLGLGLYIALEIARAHSGRIDLKSENGTTTFTVMLPRDPPTP